MSQTTKFNLRFQNLLNKEGSLKSEIQLFKIGTFVHWSGVEFACDVAFMDAMVSNFESMKSTGKDSDHVVPIDYNHGSLEYGADESKAGGWISSLRIGEDGLYATVEWTKAAAEMIKEKEFRFVSPEFATDPTDEFGENVEGPVLYAAALTNRPFLKGMAPVNLKAGQKIQTGGVDMKEKLIKLFSLETDAGEDKIVSAVESNRLVMADVEKTLECEEGKAVEAVTTLKGERDTLTANLETATKELTELKGDVAAKEAARKVEAAMKDGKILPKSKEKWLKLASDSPESFDGLIAEMVPVVEMEAKGDAKGNPPAETDLHDVAVALAAEKKISYPEAMRELEKTKPELVKAYINKTGKHPHLDS